MPANTPRGYPYPIYTDVNNFPAQAQSFANAVDADVQAQVNRVTAAMSAASVRLSATANQSIPISTDTFVTFATEEYDNAAMANLGVNNTLVTIPSDGVYLISAEVNFVNNGNATTNGRQVVIFASPGNEIAWSNLRGTTAADTELCVPFLARLLTGNTLRVRVRHNSGAAVNISARSFSVTRVAD